MDVKQDKFTGEIMSLKTDHAECDGARDTGSRFFVQRIQESSRQWLKQSAAQMGRTWS